MKLRRSLALGSMAVAAGTALPAMAQSSVTIYGAVDDALVYSSNQGGPHNLYLRTGNLNASKIGFKGSEDLGGGSQAVFTLENGFDTNTGAMASSGVLFNRQSFVGLANNSAGTVLVGRQYTPYFQYVGAIGPTSVLTGATGAHPGDVDGLDTTVRISNSVTYTTPTFSGAQVSALYGFGETAGSVSTGNTYSLALKYDVSAWNFALGYQRLRNGSGAGSSWNSTASGSFATSAVNTGYASSNNVVMIAGALRYTVDKLMVGANLSSAQYNPGAGSLFTQKAKFNTAGVITTYQATPAVALAAGYSYTKASAANGISDAATYHQVALEQTYALSKRTAFYVLEAYQLAKGKTLNASGAIVNAVAAVGDSQNSSASSGRNQTVIMLGFRHFF
jgi:predicted porin